MKTSQFHKTEERIDRFQEPLSFQLGDLCRFCLYIGLQLRNSLQILQLQLLSELSWQHHGYCPLHVKAGNCTDPQACKKQIAWWGRLLPLNASEEMDKSWQIVIKKKHSRNDSIAADINWPVNEDISRLRLFVGVTLWILGSALKNSLLLHIDLHRLAKTTHESPTTCLFAMGISYFDLLCESFCIFKMKQNNNASRSCISAPNFVDHLSHVKGPANFARRQTALSARRSPEQRSTADDEDSVTLTWVS